MTRDIGFDTGTFERPLDRNEEDGLHAAGKAARGRYIVGERLVPVLSAWVAVGESVGRCACGRRSLFSRNSGSERALLSCFGAVGEGMPERLDGGESSTDVVAAAP